MIRLSAIHGPHSFAFSREIYIETLFDLYMCIGMLDATDYTRKGKMR